MATFEEVRARLARRCSSKKLDLGAEVHAVTFQPLASRSNEDRLVVQEIPVSGQKWLLMVVCDGHGGATAARYTAAHLPGRIRATLKRLTEVDLQGEFSREKVLKKADFISSELRRCVKTFDNELGHAVQTICPDPAGVPYDEVRAVILEYPDVLARACAGTTLAAAVVNLQQRVMWAINVGDSTVALSTAGSDGKRTAYELCPRHSLIIPRERDRLLTKHPGEERVIERGRLLGSLATSRAIGDFPFKLHPTYSTHLFRWFFVSGHTRLKPSVIDRIISPPYLTADPAVRFVDLETVWHQQPILMLYTDGVDNLVNHCKYLTPWRPSYLIPSRTVAVLLQDEVEDAVEDLLGYPADLRWSGETGNRAMDVLGNLIGGKSVRILQMFLNQHLLADKHGCPKLYIDDTSIIICPLSSA